MPKKKPEMSQVYSQSNNEFIFGEKGGKGKHLLSFLKNLSLTGSLLASAQPKGSSDNINEINSSIYGSLAYGYTSPDTGGSSITNSGGKKAASAAGPLPRFPRSLLQRSLSLGSVLPQHSGSNDKSISHTDSRLSSPYVRPPSRTVSASGEPAGKNYVRRPMYTDLDDDWDAQLDDVEEIAPKEHSNERKTSNLGLLDSLHPDLTVLADAVRVSQEHKDLMDSQDLQTKLEVQKLNQMHTRFAKFRRILADDDTAVNINDLRNLLWNGVPPEVRAITWQLLLGYLPANKSRQASILKRKRQEYIEGVSSTLSTLASDSADSSNRDNSANKDKQLFHQINIDVKRTHPTLKLYSYAATQESLRKILYLWAVRHPASGYVQGINDLCTPFYQLFLNNYLWQLQRKVAHERENAEDDSALFIPGMHDEHDEIEQKLLNDPKLRIYSWETFDPALLSPRVTGLIEADTYWCISRLLDNITDNYIHQQPGIIRQVNDLRNLILKIDLPLLTHLENEGVEFIQFAFRWMNCLLMREVSMPLIVRMWDTYLSETPLGFNNFHVYVCAAFLIKFSADLKEKDFQDILLFLQNPPTASWKEKDIEMMLSEAFIWQSLYKNASAHLR